MWKITLSLVLWVLAFSGHAADEELVFRKEIRTVASQYDALAALNSALNDFTQGIERCLDAEKGILPKLATQSTEDAMAFESLRTRKLASSFESLEQINQTFFELRPAYVKAQKSLELYIENLQDCGARFVLIKQELEVFQPRKLDPGLPLFWRRRNDIPFWDTKDRQDNPDICQGVELQPQVASCIIVPFPKPDPFPAQLTPEDRENIAKAYRAAQESYQSIMNALGELRDAHRFFSNRGLEQLQYQATQQWVRSASAKHYDELADAVLNHDATLAIVQQVQAFWERMSSLESELRVILNRYHVVALADHLNQLKELIAEAQAFMTGIPPELKRVLSLELLTLSVTRLSDRLKLYEQVLAQIDPVESYPTVKTKVLTRLDGLKLSLNRNQLVLSRADQQRLDEKTQALEPWVSQATLLTREETLQTLQRLYELDNYLFYIDSVY